MQNKNEEAVNMLKNGFNEYQKISDKDKKIPHLMQSYSDIATCFLSLKKSDSAVYYYKNAKNLLTSAKKYEKRQEAAINLGLGTSYNEKKDYQSAIPYLIKSLDIAKKGQYEDIYLDVLKQLAVSFNHTSKEESNLYYKKYILAKKEYEEKNSLKPQEIEEIKNRNLSFFDRNKNTILYSTALVIVLITLVFFVQFRKHRYAKVVNQNLNENLKTKTEEISTLEKKINPAFEKVRELAKNNDPVFLKRFLEMYPEFSNSLREQFPKLTNVHFKILAFSYLNFSTKDIAKYTNTTIRTVQTHKYRIRKKININSQEDLIKWSQKFNVKE